MLKLNLAAFLILVSLIICKNESVDAQFETIRKFSINLGAKDHIESNILKNLRKKHRLAEVKKKEALRKKEEHEENLRRNIFNEYLVKKLKGSKAVLNDFYSRF